MLLVTPQLPEFEPCVKSTDKDFDIRAGWRICSLGIVAVVDLGSGSSLPAISKEVEHNWR